MGNLIEKHFIIGEDIFLSEIVLDKLAVEYDDAEYIDKPAHVVYVDNSPRQSIIASACLIGTPDKRHPNFLDLIKTIDTSNFISILVLVTVYPHWMDFPDTIIFEKNKASTQLDVFLSKTNGLLLFDYQLEQLFIMGTGTNKEQAQIFRKDINAKKAAAFEESKTIKIFGQSLHEIIAERMKYEGVFNPDYYSAHLLFQHLNT
jgi:hypothetical protein